MLITNLAHGLAVFAFGCGFSVSSPSTGGSSDGKNSSRAAVAVSTPSPQHPQLQLALMAHEVEMPGKPATEYYAVGHVECGQLLTYTE